MRISSIINRISKEYARALKLEYVRKPMSYALYRVWRWCDQYEKEQRDAGSV